MMGCAGLPLDPPYGKTPYYKIRVWELADGMNERLEFRVTIANYPLSIINYPLFNDSESAFWLPLR